MCVLWLHVCPCAICVPGACGIQEEGISSPELEGEAAVSGPSGRTTSTSNTEPPLGPLSPLSSCHPLTARASVSPSLTKICAIAHGGVEGTARLTPAPDLPFSQVQAALASLCFHLLVSS